MPFLFQCHMSCSFLSEVSVAEIEAIELWEASLHSDSPEW